MSDSVDKEKKKNWYNKWYLNLLARLILIGLSIAAIYYICPWLYGTMIFPGYEGGLSGECMVVVIVTFIVLNGFIPGVTEGSG